MRETYLKAGGRETRESNGIDVTLSKRKDYLSGGCGRAEGEK